MIIKISGMDVRMLFCRYPTFGKHMVSTLSNTHSVEIYFITVQIASNNFIFKRAIYL
ncbi:hypothetical protein [Agrobacterium tomkonis]|uniref:hypothetical protein n=1 Tax=Agrobacterium tomkonis TaxID=1183410 RepID=UPI001CD8CF75